MGRTTRIYDKYYGNDTYKVEAVQEVWYKTFGFSLDRIIFDNNIPVKHTTENYGYGETEEPSFIISRENLEKVLKIATGYCESGQGHGYGSWSEISPTWIPDDWKSVVYELTIVLAKSDSKEFYVEHSD